MTAVILINKRITHQAREDLRGVGYQESRPKRQKDFFPEGGNEIQRERERITGWWVVGVGLVQHDYEMFKRGVG